MANTYFRNKESRNDTRLIKLAICANLLFGTLSTFGDCASVYIVSSPHFHLHSTCSLMASLIQLTVTNWGEHWLTMIITSR